MKSVGTLKRITCHLFEVLFQTNSVSTLLFCFVYLNEKYFAYNIAEKGGHTILQVGQSIIKNIIKSIRETTCWPNRTQLNILTKSKVDFVHKMFTFRSTTSPSFFFLLVSDVCISTHCIFFSLSLLSFRLSVCINVFVCVYVCVCFLCVLFYFLWEIGNGFGKVD